MGIEDRTIPVLAASAREIVAGREAAIRVRRRRLWIVETGVETVAVVGY